MIFTEFRFFEFFILVFVGYWGLKSHRVRKVWLLAASYWFYAAWDWRFLGLIAVSTLVDYHAGRQIARSADTGQRRFWLWLSVSVNLSILGFFKYFNFFVESGAELLGWLGVSVSVPTLAIVLPVGISFYTFQTMSYTIDVYRRDLKPADDLLDLALFVGFFPQLVAGPIVRARSFLPQLATVKVFGDVDVRGCLLLFLGGFIKKAVVSDGIAVWIDAYYENPEAYDLLSVYVAVLLYAVQIYCDFSGYSDMAIGCAGLLGYQLCLNFHFPYFSPNLAAFWQRWHISLSSWLQDYVYISLGGGRGSFARTSVNLLITMLLCGLWHGADWRFVVFGGMQGVGLTFYRLWARGVTRRYSPATQTVMTGLGAILTFYWICLSLIVFRAQDFPDAIIILRAFVLGVSGHAQQLSLHLYVVFIVLAALHFMVYRGVFSRQWRKLPSWGFAAVYGVLVAVTLTGVQPNVEPFIYFQF